ncbi:hypothetical protein NIE88_11915 [Sporolactobacillus shoreicorticis]|uniref:Uncharacterized protein n=1 Tax=Sporolactobacillus shoreicorticis TaxID=1923877 RepID=A0ABW5S280_9BACL|nr:hypothetical protein [Sporolactobacillus shoreicorticis]MCO7126472.1 hypothetical protein [Sporolactobacillus shoreicorticis]
MRANLSGGSGSATDTQTYEAESLIAAPHTIERCAINSTPCDTRSGKSQDSALIFRGKAQRRSNNSMPRK